MKRLLFLIAFAATSSTLSGQGCSDAGFCTMGAMKPDQPFNKKVQLKLRSMEMSFYRGTTTLTPIIYVATADFSFSLNSKNTVQVKLPFQHVEGRLATTSGSGDISLCYTRNIYTSDQFDLNLSFGGKVLTNHSDKSIEGLPLPMYYQTSLGTYDLISGLSLINRKWLIATGIQIPFNHNNNQFWWSRWEGGPEDMDYVKQYSQANQLRRGTDVMLRVERNFRLSRFNFTLGLLPIYRIVQDEVEKLNGERVAPDEIIPGAKTTGLALSAITTVGYSFNVRSGIKLLLGKKIVQRNENPDGLTRHFVSSFTYSYRF